MIEWLVDLLLANITPTVSVFELIWTLVGVAAFMRFMPRTARSWRARRRSLQENDPLTIRAREKLRCERFLFLMVMSECLVGTGIWAMSQPPGPAAIQGDPWALLNPGLLIVMAVCLFLKGETEERNEQALTRLYMMQIEKNGSLSAADVTGYGMDCGRVS